MQMAMVETQTAADVQSAYLLAHRGEETIIEKAISWHQVFCTLVDGLLPHAIDTRSKLPAVHLWREIMQVIIDGMQEEVESTLIGMLFLLKLLTAILLIPQQEFQISIAQVPGVIKHRLVMMYLLIRHRLAITLQVIAIGHQELTRLLISLTLHKSWGKMVIIERKMRMSQAIVIAQQLREGLLTIRGAKDITIIFVLVGMRHLATISGVPNKASLVACKVERIIEKTVVGLIARGNIRPHISHRKSW